MHSSMTRRSGRTTLAVMALTALMFGTVQAQQAPATLTLEQALSLARRNNPDFQIQKSNEGPAEWSVRQAYAGFLPTVSTSLGMQYQAKGNPQLGIFSGQQLGLSGSQSYYYSDYSISLGYQLSGSTFFKVPQAQANRDAVSAQTAAAGYNLDAAVTQQYLAVLAAQDAVALNKSELQSNEENLKLAQAKVQVGDAIALEAKQAEVERGRAEVALIKAQNQLESARLQLGQQIGVSLAPDVQLTTRFQVFDPSWSLEDLLHLAESKNPNLRASRATTHATSAALRMARTAYLPSLSLSLNYAGYTRQAGDTGVLLEQADAAATNSWASCSEFNQISERLTSPLPGFPLNCSQYLLTDAQRQSILSQNNAFPFRFTPQPLTFQARISLPIFSGFSRQQQIEQAQANSDNATYRLKADRLKLRTDVTTALNDLRTAYRAFTLEERNDSLAVEQLLLARERYRVGLTSFVDLIQAETLKARADQSLFQARYDFYGSFAALESAVGEPLSQPDENQ